VHDAHAAQAARRRRAHEFRHLLRCLPPVHAVQVEAVLYHPVAAPQPAQHLARHAIAQVGEFDAGVECVIHRHRAGDALGEDGALVAPGLRRHRRRGRVAQQLAARLGERLDAGKCPAQRFAVVGVRHSAPQAACRSRNFSASSAAMQPVAALVTAWR
jgi:hypothetical protein